MVSIVPHTHLFPPRLLKLPLSTFSRHSFPLRLLKSTPKPISFSSTANAFSSSNSNSPASPERIRTLFPGGFKRPEISIPTLILSITADEAVNRVDAINSAISRGVGIVILEGGEDGGGRVYEAARALKNLISDRAYLLIAERVDVASAVGANGVVLKDDGIPTIVARNMMMQSNSDSIYLPLVARVVTNLDSAQTASSSEGADFLIINTNSTNISKLLEDSIIINQPVKVPIFFTNKSNSPNHELLNSGASGIITSLPEFKLLAEDTLKLFEKKHEVDKDLKTGKVIPGSLEESGNGIPGFMKIGEAEKELIERERTVLNEAVNVIRKAVPTVIF